MKLETLLLRPVIAMATQLAAKRTTLPILNHLLLDGSNGALDVSATDIDMYASAHVEKKSGSLAPCCIPARSFNALIEGAGEFVTLEADNDKLVVSSDSWTRRMSTLPVVEYPQRPDVNGMKQLAVPAYLLAQAVWDVKWAGDENPSDNRYWKSSILIEMAAKSLKATASDSHSFAHCAQKIICSDATFMLPIKAVDLFCEALAGENVQLLHSDKRIIITHDSGFFSCVLAVDKWPDYKPILARERISIGACTVAPLLASLERAATVYVDKFAPVTLKVENGEWTISAESQLDTYTETFKPAKTNTSKRTLSFNASLLIEALKVLKAEDVPVFSVNPEEQKNGGLFIEVRDLIFSVARLHDKA